MDHTTSAGHTEYYQKRDVFQAEILRKSLHLLIALVPLLASVNLPVTVGLLASGSIVYTLSEVLRVYGLRLTAISRLTMLASRQRSERRVEFGPVTLAVGAMLALMLYPAPAASIAIYALAFGDGFAGLIGRNFGRVRIPFTGGKTFIGSLACFIAVYFIALSITGNVQYAFFIALGATILEAAPVGDMDNVLLPVGTGFIATLFLTL
ncbi:MAG: phosphatidate cytidylyltransferase [Spirochaetales bacterium]|nr:phosphatidate cytidylyltransferase [Spirochaetales bacterium]MCF7939542.1 phosphatidate cytidylyltransferase [Spirochaetales bacterium]